MTRFLDAHTGRSASDFARIKFHCREAETQEELTERISTPTSGEATD